MLVPRSLQIPPMQSFLTILEIWPNGLGSKDSDYRCAALRLRDDLNFMHYLYYVHVGLHISHTNFMHYDSMILM